MNEECLPASVLPPEVEAEIDAILNPIRDAHPGISNQEIVNYLPKHLRQPFWERAVTRYLDEKLANLPAVTVTDADQLAEFAHRGQVDKAGRPYIEHVRAVAEALRPHGDEAVMAGLLHDIIEDTELTTAALRYVGYPETVIAAVDSVTRRPGEPYMDMIRRAAADPLGRLVKLADNANNSDPARLALLDEEQRDWFTRKYAEARAVLEAAAPGETDAVEAGR